MKIYVKMVPTWGLDHKRHNKRISPEREQINVSRTFILWRLKWILNTQATGNRGWTRANMFSSLGVNLTSSRWSIWDSLKVTNCLIAKTCRKWITKSHMIGDKNVDSFVNFGEGYRGLNLNGIIIPGCQREYTSELYNYRELLF